ncbi:IS630 family transposase [Salicibibacter cibarius]|uniref:IS630 family transposase n=1 Tax=Salicibibacter cibarius TaxID=2743000 RepID=A0A7T7CDB2_9BACI|nr:IS630 family transposase [Salicibibacter cibarius]QQK77795.1 IS630 family transposase [Salicibibacter cibarius]
MLFTFDASTEQRQKLANLLRSGKTEVRIQFRAQIIWSLAVLGQSIAKVARQQQTSKKTVRKWRDRFMSDGVEGLRDQPRPGAPPTYTIEERCEVIAIACDAPKHYGFGERPQWTLDLLVETIEAEHDLKPMSRSSIHRTLIHNDLKPHKFQMWLHSKDPHFKEKVNSIVSLYLNPPADTRVLCIDEKTGIQALERKYETKRPKPGVTGRFEHEYMRHGTQSLFASFDIQTGEVFAQCRSGRKAEDIQAFMEDLAEHYQDDTNITVIWDNLNIHYDGPSQRWTTFNQGHANTFTFVYTPIHASWMNQIDIFFSILQRRCLKHASFHSVQDLAEKVMAFIHRWNETDGHPFEWMFKGYPMQNAEKEAA